MSLKPMIERTTIKAGSGRIDALLMNLGSKNLIVLRGARGYIMCGYLNLVAARKFKDAAVKITGVSTISEALRATVHSCTPEARKLGIYPGQPVHQILKLIA